MNLGDYLLPWKAIPNMVKDVKSAASGEGDSKYDSIFGAIGKYGDPGGALLGDKWMDFWHGTIPREINRAAEPFTEFHREKLDPIWRLGGKRAVGGAEGDFGRITSTKSGDLAAAIGAMIAGGMALGAGAGAAGGGSSAGGSFGASSLAPNAGWNAGQLGTVNGILPAQGASAGSWTPATGASQGGWLSNISQQDMQNYMRLSNSMQQQEQQREEQMLGPHQLQMMAPPSDLRSAIYEYLASARR